LVGDFNHQRQAIPIADSIGCFIDGWADEQRRSASSASGGTRQR
jgi:hypothetical protein